MSNVRIDRTLAKSFEDFADRLKDGRGFWKKSPLGGSYICSDPFECKMKEHECRDKASALRSTYA